MTNKPEIDSHLEHMKKVDLPQTRVSLNLGFHAEFLIAVPQPTVELAEHRGAQQEEQQDAQAHIRLFLVKTHNCSNVQTNVEHQEHKTQNHEEEVHTTVLKHSLGLWNRLIWEQRHAGTLVGEKDNGKFERSQVQCVTTPTGQPPLELTAHRKEKLESACLLFMLRHFCEKEQVQKHKFKLFI